MGDISKNFNRSEFACKCNCGFDNIDMRVVRMAQTIRDALGVAIRISSGCRCEKHNRNVGGVPKKKDGTGGSKHMYGLAADLVCSLGAKKMFDTIQALYKDGKLPDLSYCIYYKRKNFCHIDCGPARNSRFEVRN